MPSTLYNFVTSIKRNIIVFVLLEQVIRRHFVTFNENTLEKKKTSDILAVFLQCQLWIVNYYVKSLSTNLSNKNINTGVSREMII